MSLAERAFCIRDEKTKEFKPDFFILLDAVFPRLDIVTSAEELHSW